MDLRGFSKLINATLPLEAAEEMKMFREPSSTWSGQESVVCSLEDFKLNKTQNRYTIKHSDVPFECLYLPSDNKKLYVSLSGGGPKGGRRYPWFIRWKYKNFLNGNVLCIDDPMYYFHPEIISVMWYYGTKEVSYLHLLLDIVKKFMEQLEIEAKDVTFIGSSGGGYASLYCANLLDYSSAIAVNPQIVLKDWQYPNVYNYFYKWGIDLAKEDKFNRNNIFLTNNTSHFCIVMNVYSMKEAELQFNPFFERNRIIPKYGISQKENIITWIHATNYNQPHSAIPTKVGFAFADYLLYSAKREMNCINEITNISLLANEVLYEKYDLMDKLESNQIEKNTIYKFFIHNLSMKIKKNLCTKIPLEASDTLKEFLGYNYEVKVMIPSNGNIGYYIGEQKKYRYNIFYHNGNIYFRLKFDNFSENFKSSEDFIEYLNRYKKVEQITRWHINQEDTLIVSYVLVPEFAENQINNFIDLTLEIINKYL